MSVKELIELLSKEDQDAIVVIAKDSEGNRYSPFSALQYAAYLADSTWSGSVGLLSLTPEAIADGYSEEDLNGGEPAVVLYPVS
jgi:hypothetical protein